MPSVKMDRVRVRAEVPERDSHAIALGRANRRTRHLAVVRPGRKEKSRGDLNLTIDGEDLVLAKQRPVVPGRLAVEPRTFLRRHVREVPAAQKGRWIEELARRATDRSHRVGGMGRMREYAGLAVQARNSDSAAGQRSEPCGLQPRSPADLRHFD